MDRKLGKRVPIAMFRVVERVARGIHRLYLVSLKESTAHSLPLFFLLWGFGFAHMRDGMAAAIVCGACCRRGNANRRSSGNSGS
jgi:hypothetical protein